MPNARFTAPRAISAALLSAALSLPLLIAGCAHPLQKTTQQSLRRELIKSHTAYLDTVATAPVIELSRAPDDVSDNLTQERRDELDAMGGPTAYQNQPLNIGVDLLGTADRDNPDDPDAKTTSDDVVNLSLQSAIQMAAKNNLDVESARFTPAISQAQITQAEANFDAVIFFDANYNITDTPRPGATAGGAFSSISTGPLVREEFNARAGIRKTLTTGGVVELATSFQRLDENPSIFGSTATAVGSFVNYTTSAEASIVQPLLRNFGSDINRTQILISENTKADAVENLRQTLIDRLFQTEQAYWQLAFARQQLLVAQRLLKRGIVDRDRIVERLGFDASQVEATQANATVGERRSQLIVAKQNVRNASDNLKGLIDSEDLPVSGETLIIPTDTALDLPIEYSLLDAVTTALRKRPVMQQALLNIDSNTLRQRFFDNQRLPQLDVSLTLRYNGEGNSPGDAYDDIADTDFIDYLLALQFEVPIGNRGPEAAFREAILERQQAVVDYRRSAKNVVLEVKAALRQVITTYELIGSTRSTRLAAADNLRAIEAQAEAGEALTPAFIDLKLRRQDALANAEIQEMQAIADYNIAIAAYYQALGTGLDRNNIIFSEQPVADPAE